MSVETTAFGLVVIGQPNPSSDEDHRICLEPVQVPILIEWLNEAMREIASGGAAAAENEVKEFGG